MVEEAQDAPEEEVDHEHVVLSRWERLQKWWSMIMAIKKTVAFLLGFGAVSVAGNINDTNYWREAACEVGIGDCVVSAEPDTEQIVSDETVSDHTHDHYHEHSHEMKAHSHSHKHELEPHSHPTPVSKEELKNLIKDALNEVVPPDHMKLH